MTSISGVDFQDAWDGRVEQTKEGRTLPFLGLEAPLANKIPRVMGRARSIARAP